MVGPQPSYRPLSTSEEIDLRTLNSERKSSDSERPESDSPSSRAYNAIKRHFNFSSSFLRSENIEWLQKVSVAFLIALIPSFLRRDGKPTTARKLHPTAWLDGLRGVASLMVVFHHSSVLWFLELNRGWGSSDNDWTFVQLPIIRLFYSGPSMVALFFVVSGISLSYKPLGLIRQGRFDDVLDSLSSSVMRRGLRLTIPPAVTTFFAMLATYLHWYGTGPGSRQPPQSEYIVEHLQSWFYSVIGLLDPFRPRVYPNGYNPVYDTNLWTIPVEFHGSMVIFSVILGLSKVRRGYRLLILTLIVLFLSHYAYGHLFLFLSGVLLTEVHYERNDIFALLKTVDWFPLETSEDSETLISPDATSEKQLNWIRGIKIFWCIYFLLALFVLSMPMMDFGGGQSPGYITLASWIPAKYRAPYVVDHFWVFNGAVHVVFAVDNAAFLQAIFTTRIAQYLGKISFALYICHGTFLYTLGYNLSARMVAYTGNASTAQYSTGIFLTVCVVYPLLFWTADLVAIYVDARGVSFARWLWKKIEVK